MSNFEGNYEQEEKLVSFEEEVESFLINLHDHVYHRNAEAIKKLFDVDFYMISDVYFKNIRWPSIELVDTFYKQKNRYHNLIHSLYEELYYRHVFIINDITLEDRKNAWENYKCLLNFILSICYEQSGEKNDNIFMMPSIWVYDFLSEYVYQYQSMCHLKQNMLKDIESYKEGVEFINQNLELNDSNLVLEVLHSLFVNGEYVNLPEEQRVSFVTNMFHINNENISTKYQFSYFSCCSLLNVYVLMCDYYNALKIISYIEFNHKALYWKVLLCHLNMFYNISFCYMMLRRYNDAIKILTHFLIYLSKQKLNLSNQLRYQQGWVHNLIYKLYLIVMICHSLCNIRLDETILHNIKEKYASKFYALQNANEQTYTELFYKIAPKFIDPISNISFQLLTKLENGENDLKKYNADITARQLDLFLKDVRYQKKVFHFISYAKLYNNIQLNKLSSLMNYNNDNIENVCSDIMCVKNCSRQLVWKEGALYTGEQVTNILGNNFDFYIDIDILNIKTRKQQKLFIDYFLHQIKICKNLSNTLQGTGSTNVYKTKFENYKQKKIKKKQNQKLSIMRYMRKF
uniref:Eukaryotic translation initiation factor 3 subunit L n=1 Tax=Piliocolobus tephrosceles TaxID=591936 RepID=A0A8C9GIE3_9PRIM